MSATIKALLCVFLTTVAWRASADPALSLDGKTYGLDELARERQGDFYELEHKKYELVQQIAEEKFLDAYFAKLGREHHVSPERAKSDYLAAHAKVTASEVEATLERFKDHPSLRAQSDAERKRAVTDYLSQMKERDA